MIKRGDVVAGVRCSRTLSTNAGLVLRPHPAPLIKGLQSRRSPTSILLRAAPSAGPNSLEIRLT